MEPNPNILLLVLDTVRASRLSCYGYEQPTTPHLDEFSEQATKYEYAISEGCWTVPSHASMFTGEPSTIHGSHAYNRTFDNNLPTLAELLSESGYRTLGSSRNAWVTSEHGFDRGFDVFDDSDYAQLYEEEFDVRESIHRHEGKKPLHRYSSILGDAITCGKPHKALLNLLYFKYRDSAYCDDGARMNNRFATEVFRNEEQPWFLFLNYMEAHEPYYAKHAHREAFLPDKVPSREAFDESAKWDFHANRTNPPFDALADLYDAEIRLLDERIGSLLSSLEREGHFNDSLIIITGDHGQHFGEHGLMGHVASPYPEAIHVPLLISRSGQRQAENVEEPVSIREVFNEVTEAAGIEFEDEETITDVTISHCFGSQEQVFDMYPELDADRWNEPLATFVSRYRDTVYGVVCGLAGRREVYRIADSTVVDNPPENVVDTGLREEALNELRDAVPEGRSSEPGDVSQRLRDLGYL